MRHFDLDHLWRYADLTLRPRARTRLREHARDCHRCGRELERVLVTRRALGGLEDCTVPRTEEIEAWGAEVLERALPAPTGKTRWWGAAMALAAASIVVGVVSLSGSGPDPDDLRARGHIQVPSFATRLVCIQRDGPTTHIWEPDRNPCPVGSFLKVLVGNVSGNRRHLAVLLVHGTDMEFLYPDDPRKPLPALSDEMSPLSGSKQLDGSLRGRLRVVVLALQADRLRKGDALLEWARTADQGVHRDVLFRADAVIREIEVGEAP